MTGYLSDEMRRRVRQEAGDRCGYCLSPQYLVMGTLKIEHVIPKSAGGADEEANLWLACRLCNCFKSNQTRSNDPQTGQTVTLFHPREQKWEDHFTWNDEDTRIVGKTACGRATVAALRLNNLVAVTVRGYWVQAGWHPPKR